MLNLNRGVLDVCAVRAPGLGDVRRAYLEDICTFTGASFITRELGRKPSNVTLADLGYLERSVAEKDKTLLVACADGRYQEAVEQRVESLKAQLGEKLAAAKEFEAQRLEQRITKLRGIVARILLGAATETELEDKRLRYKATPTPTPTPSLTLTPTPTPTRYEDAINALKGGIAEGMVPGGGSCYAYMMRYIDEIKASLPDDEERLATDIICQAMGEPCSQIAHNAGLLGPMVLEKVKGQEWGYGFNANTQEYENLLEAGVCDPASVTTWALDNAASIAATLLNTEAIVADREVEEIDEEDYRPEITTGIGADAGSYGW